MDFCGDYVDGLLEVWASVPDMTFTTEEISDGEDGTIHVKGMQYKGPHTGAPYSFGDYPKVDANGAACFSEVETMEFVVEKDKIKHVRLFLVEGALAGPPRFYTQMGGSLDP